MENEITKKQINLALQGVAWKIICERSVGHSIGFDKSLEINAIFAEAPTISKAGWI